MSPKIAIIGLGMRFPGGCNSKDDLYQLLRSKGDAVQDIPASRWNRDTFHGTKTDPGRMCMTRGGFVSEIERFDSLEFGISPNEAHVLDPSIRLSLEAAHQALQDSGTAYRGSKTGVYCAQLLLSVDELPADPNVYGDNHAIGRMVSHRANKISYHFDLSGPSLFVDTACSASATALQLAVHAIECNDITQALIIGASQSVNPEHHILLSKLGVLSPTGSCKSFDAKADGYVRSEGFGAFMIKRLDLAEKDGDHVYAVIAGTAINANGKGTSLTMPNAARQGEVIRTAYERAGRRPKDAMFVELHATGTKVGDPIEANEIGEIFSADKTPEEFTRIGSIKANVGHMEGCSFVASLMKVCLMFEHRQLLPNIRFEDPNPKIFFEKYRLTVQTEVEDMTPEMAAPDGTFVTSISSFGVGGSNAHVVLLSPPSLRLPAGNAAASVATSSTPAAAEAANALGSAKKLFVIGTNSTASMARFTATVQKEYLDITDERLLSSLSREMGRQARGHTHRSWAVASNILTARFSQPVAGDGKPKKVCLVFSGQGPQHVVMGRELSAAFPSFRKSIEEMDSLYQRHHSGRSFLEETGLFLPGSTCRLAANGMWPVQAVVVSLVMFQIALTDLIRSMGLEFHLVVGHSIGEIAMGYAAGCVTRDAAMEIAFGRAASMEIVEGNGVMAALSCNEKRAGFLIKRCLTTAGVDSGLWVAACNSTGSVTVAGEESLIDAIVQAASRKSILARKLRVSCAFHTPLMNSAEGTFKRLVSPVFTSRPAVKGDIPIMSTAYCWDNIRQPVYFRQAMDAILEEHGAANLIFVEVAPHPVLRAYIDESGAPAITLVRRPNPKTPAQNKAEDVSVLAGLGELVCAGANSLDFNLLAQVTGGASAALERMQLPPYPYQKILCSVESPASVAHRNRAPALPLGEPLFNLHVASHPSLRGHRIMNAVIFPGAGYMDAMFQRGATVITNLEFRKALVIPETEGELLYVGLKVDAPFFSFQSSVNNAYDRAGLVFDTTHACGDFLSQPRKDRRVRHADFSAIVDSLGSRSLSLTADAFYKALPVDFQYAEHFSNLVQSVHEADGSFYTHISIPESAQELLDGGYVVHPAILDSIIQTAFATMIDFQSKEFATPLVFLPSRVGRVIRWDAEDDMRQLLQGDLWIRTTVVEWAATHVVVDYEVVQASSWRVILTLDNMRLEAVPSAETLRLPSVHSPYRLTTAWQPSTFLSAPRDLALVGQHDMENARKNHHHVLKETYGFLADLLDRFNDDEDKTRLRDECRAARWSPETGLRADVYPRRILDKIISATADQVSWAAKLAANEASLARAVRETVIGSALANIPLVIKELLRQSDLASTRRSVRILEFGRGFHPVVVALGKTLVELKTQGIHVEYTVADVSLAGCEYAVASSRHETLRSTVIDPDQCLSSGFAQDIPYDIVIAAAGGADWSALLASKGVVVQYQAVVPADLANIATQLLPTTATLWEQADATLTTPSRHQQFLHDACAEYTLLYKQDEEASNVINTPQFHHFQMGTESMLIPKITSLNPDQELWVIGTDNAEGHLAFGIVASLALEKPNAKLRAVLFADPITSAKKREAWIAVHRHALPLEPLLRVDPHGRVLVRRLVTAAPALDVRLDSGLALSLIMDGFFMELTEVYPAEVRSASIRVSVHAVSLSATGQQHDFCEFAGIVDAVGRDVVSLSSGDRVMGFAQANPASVMVISERSVVRIPNNVSFEEATAVLIPYVGPLYGADCKLRVTSTDHVLVCDAGSMSGFAFADVCLRRGAQVLCVVTDAHQAQKLESLLGVSVLVGKHLADYSAEARAWLRERNLASFHVVVNAGEERAAIVEADFLTPIGSFAELAGSRQRPVQARETSDAHCLVTVDVRSLTLHAPNILRDLLVAIVEMHSHAKFQIPPMIVNSLVSAKKELVGHDIGTRRVVLSCGDWKHLVPAKQFEEHIAQYVFNPSRSYVLIGGCSELGLAIAEWMVKLGARHIYLTSRRGDRALAPSDRRMIRHLANAFDAEVEAVAADATVAAEMQGFLDTVSHPVAGVLLMTVVLRDGLFDGLNQQAFDDTYHAKLGALDVVRELFDLDSLDFLLLFSSIVSVFGNPGQTAYGAAQMYFDQIATVLPNTISMSVPPIVDRGVFKRLLREKKSMKSSPLEKIGVTSDQLCEFIGDALCHKVPHYVPMMSIEHVPAAFEGCPPALYAHLLAGSASNSDEAMTGEEDGGIRALVGRTIGMDSAEVDDHITLVAYGLDSIGAVKLSNVLRDSCGIQVSQLQLLGQITVAELRNMVATDKKTAGQSDQLIPIVQAHIDAGRDFCAPASPHQSRFWIAQQAQQDNAFNEAYWITLAPFTGEWIDVDRLQSSIAAVFQRHAALSTTFEYDDGAQQLMQKVHASYKHQVELVDAARLEDAVVSERRIAEAKNQTVRFVLNRLPLVECRVVQLPERKVAIDLAFHHVVIDAMSVFLVIEECMKMYKSGGLPPVQMQYPDFTEWQRSLSDSAALQSQRDYWTATLAGLPKLDLRLPKIVHAEPDSAAPVVSHKHHLDPTVATGFAELCKTLIITPAAGYFAVACLTLHKLSGSTATDFAMGTPCSDRYEFASLQETVGVFVNMLALRVKIDTDSTVESFLISARDVWLGALGNADVPFDEVVANLPAGVEDRALFHHLISIEAEDDQQVDDLAEIVDAELTFDKVAGRSKYDLTFAVNTVDLVVNVGFNHALYGLETAQGAAGMFAHLLQAAVDGPSTVISRLSALPDEENDVILRKYSNVNSQSSAPMDAIHHLIEEQARKTPEAPALEAGTTTVTYRQLDQRANQLARYLSAVGVGPDHCVPFCLERSVEQIVVILAILKAGGAYVALDPAQPFLRHAAILADCQATKLLTSKALLQQFEALEAVEVVVLEALESVVAAESTDVLLVDGASLSDLAYILYTSGSSGTPSKIWIMYFATCWDKPETDFCGVMIEHRSVTHLTWSLSQSLHMSASTRTLAMAPAWFDGSLIEIYGTLVFGGTLCLAPAHQVLADLAGAIRQARATFISTTPTIISMLAVTEFHNLDTLLIGGEPFTKSCLDLCAQKRSLRILGAYGPTGKQATRDGVPNFPAIFSQANRFKTFTETTLIVLTRDLTLNQKDLPLTSIGRPTVGAHAYILDDNLMPVPVGVAGVLYIGGIQVAPGYLGRPDLTAASYIASPFASSERLYRTGDLCRWLADGQVEFLGRKDDQVKLRGMRVELQEVESVLMSHPSVRGAAVAVRTIAGAESLVGFVEPRGDPQPDFAAGLRKHAESFLPTWMVPSVFHTLQALPVTVNGKLDRRALKAVELLPELDSATFESEDFVELELFAIFKELLGHEAFHASQDLFTTGLHSLLIIGACGRIRKRLHVELFFKDVFANPSVRAIAKLIAQRGGPDSAMIVMPSILDINTQGAQQFPASSSQKRMFYAQELTDVSNAYHIPLLLHFPKALDDKAFNAAIKEMWKRHPIFRTTFRMEDDQISQVVHASIENDVRVVAVSGADGVATATKLADKDNQHPYDLATGPLVRVTLFALNHGSIVHFNVHHILVDEWSIALFMSELDTVYHSLLSSTEFSLAPVTRFCPDFAQAEGVKLLDACWKDMETEWWTELLQDCEPLRLPLLEERTDDQPAAELRAPIPREITDAFLAQMVSLGITPFMGFFAAFGSLLLAHSGQTDVCIGTVASLRDSPGMTDVMGMLTNTLAVPVRGEPAHTFSNFARRFADTFALCLDHKDLPLSEVTEALSSVRANQDVKSLLRAVFVFNAHVGSGQTAPSWLSRGEATRVPVVGQACKFPLTLVIEQTSADEYVVAAQYPEQTSEKPFVASLVHDYAQLLEQIGRSPELHLASVKALERPTVAEAAASPPPQIEQKILETVIELCPATGGSLSATAQLAAQGVNKLTILKLLHRINATFSTHLTAADMTENLTVRALATRVSLN
ncbi:hypothetical protein HKX48_000987 [Thoreauomyces humboldtii]|nr:hypothetical protein HKX48_000987 [Thoreauomyces humboldtii]